MNPLLDELRIPRGASAAPAAPGAARRPRRRKALLVASALLVMLAVGSWLVLARADSLVVDVVTVADAASGSPAAVLTAGGYVKDPRIVYVAPRVAGRIAALMVREGDEIKQGDVVALLDSRDLEQDANEARAGVDLAGADLRKLEVGSRPEAIAEARARCQAVELASQRAQRELDRTRALFDAGVVSPQAFDQARTESEIAVKNLDAARQSLAAVEAGPRPEEIGAAKASLAAAQARWQTASNRLSYTRVAAPVAGRVLRKFRNVGDFVSPDAAHIEAYETVAIGSPVVSLAEVGQQEVSADINETDIARITLHQAVEIAPNAYPGEVFHGSVTRVSPRADRNKNTVEVKVTIQRAGRVLPYDLSVKLTFLAQPQASAPREGVAIPARAVVEKGGRRWVFVAVNSKALLRAVELGPREGEMVRVTGGLADGDRVIVSGLSAITNGSAVSVR